MQQMQTQQMQSSGKSGIYYNVVYLQSFKQFDAFKCNRLLQQQMKVHSQSNTHLHGTKTIVND